MSRKHLRKWAALAALLAVLLLPAAGVNVGRAASPCQKVEGTFAFQFVTGPSCSSPTGSCVAGTMKGDLKGTFEGVGTAVIPTADTPTTGVLFLTGDVVHHPKGGDLLGKTAIAYNSTSGVFSELDSVTGGTGAWSGATGYLQLFGTADATSAAGAYRGQICTN